MEEQHEEEVEACLKKIKHRRITYRIKNNRHLHADSDLLYLLLFVMLL